MGWWKTREVITVTSMSFVTHAMRVTVQTFDESDSYFVHDFSSFKVQIMPPYDDWNKIDEDEDEELQDISVSTWLQQNKTRFNGYKLRCTRPSETLSCSASIVLNPCWNYMMIRSTKMFKLATFSLHSKLQCKFKRRKSSLDRMILLESCFLTQWEFELWPSSYRVIQTWVVKTRKSETTRQQGSEIKKNTFLFQPITPLSAPKIQEIIQLLDGLSVILLSLLNYWNSTKPLARILRS